MNPEDRYARRDFLIFGAGIIAASAGFGWLLPPDTKARLGIKNPVDSPAKTGFMKKVLAFDDTVAKSLYSPNHTVPTYDKSMAVTGLRNNYNGQTPDPAYLDNWHLTLKGLSNGSPVYLKQSDFNKFPFYQQVTRLVCVEGWSAITWWGGIRFADFMKAYPPHPKARWVHLMSDVNLDNNGDPDPYFVSLDIESAAHSQTLLATQWNGQPLSVEHGAPLRLIAPMKLGLKNIKAITHIEYTVNEPPDYWNQYGYSKYDGV